MNEPKYQIGDRISETRLLVRGIAPQSSGEYIYFVQIIESNNCLVITQSDIDVALAIFYKSVDKQYQN